MKVFPKVPRLSFLIVFAAIVSGRAKAQQQEANRAGEALYKQRCAAWRQTALGCSRCRRRTSGLLAGRKHGRRRTGIVNGANRRPG